MSVWEEIGDIKKQVLGSDLPETITATICSVTKTTKKGEYAGAPVLKVELMLKDGSTFSTTYRIPKSWTGKGQLDIFKQQLEKLKCKLDKSIVGKTFEWKRMELPGAMKGNERHYPIKMIKEEL